jgi:hypothetical protein
MNRHLDPIPCSACVVHVGFWAPPDRMCPACRNSGAQPETTETGEDR